MVTHDPRIAAHADRIIFLKDGTVVDDTVLSGNGRGAPAAVQQRLEAAS
jgi:putative ABC transport system ATP-binding protein